MTTPQQDRIDFYIRSLASEDPQSRIDARMNIVDRSHFLSGNPIKLEALAKKLLAITIQPGDSLVNYMRMLGDISRYLPSQHREMIVQKFDSAPRDVSVLELVTSAMFGTPVDLQFIQAAWQQLLKRPEQLPIVAKRFSRHPSQLSSAEKAVIADKISELSAGIKGSNDERAVQEIIRVFRSPPTPRIDAAISRLLDLPGLMKAELGRMQLAILDSIGKADELPEATFTDWDRWRVLVYRFESCLENVTAPCARILHIAEKCKPTHILLSELNIGVRPATDSEITAEHLSDVRNSPEDLDDIKALVGKLSKQFKVVGFGGDSSVDEVQRIQQSALLRGILLDPSARILVVDHQTLRGHISVVRSVEKEAVFVGETVLLAENTGHPLVQIVAKVARKVEELSGPSNEDLLIDIPGNKIVEPSTRTPEFYAFGQCDIVNIRIPDAMLKNIV